MSPFLFFETLPVELQCSIIRYLDPITLISISQVNTHLRTLVKPSKSHFGERLLALECLEEVGGPQIRFSRTGTVEPHRNSPEWEANCWACTSCLSLLPHYAFNNQSLSRLCYRKPIPGSPVAKKCTSWEPTPKSGRALQNYSENCHSETERQLRRRYTVVTTQNWWKRRPAATADLHQRLLDLQGCGIAEFKHMTLDEFESLPDKLVGLIFDREARAVELLQAGSNRYDRHCIECRFQRGEFRGCMGRHRGIGTPDVPIVVGRQVSFGTVVDRYFPDISEVLETKRPPSNGRVSVIYGDNLDNRPCTLYRVRCPGCSTWRELRAFRVGGTYPSWQPMDNDAPDTVDHYSNWDGLLITEKLLNGLRCNHCFVGYAGRGALGAVILKWLESLINTQLGELTADMMSGFNTLLRQFKNTPKQWKPAVKALLRDMRPLLEKVDLKLTRIDVALLRQRRAQFIDLNPQCVDFDAWNNAALFWFQPDRWFMDWMNYYDESEALWFWLKEVKEEIHEEGKAYVLADWVLSRDERAES